MPSGPAWITSDFAGPYWYVTTPWMWTGTVRPLSLEARARTSPIVVRTGGADWRRDSSHAAARTPESATTTTTRAHRCTLSVDERRSVTWPRPRGAGDYFADLSTSPLPGRQGGGDSSEAEQFSYHPRERDEP